jgi:hypothetical protein
LIAEVRLPPDIHVYAPGTKGYTTVSLVMDGPPELELTPALYPYSPPVHPGDQFCATAREGPRSGLRVNPRPLSAPSMASAENLPGPKISTSREAIRNV